MLADNACIVIRAGGEHVRRMLILSPTPNFILLVLSTAGCLHLLS